MRLTSSLTGAAAILCALHLSAAADTLHVPADYPTIQSAINAANRGDIVLVADGIYAGVGNTDIDFLGKAITVHSANGPHQTRIVGWWPAAQGRAFWFHSGETSESIVDGFTMINGFGMPGGGAILISNNSSPTIKNCVITDCYGYDYGGAIMIQSGSPAILNCTFAENYTDFFGGALFIQGNGNTTLADCTFSGNTGAAWGGGILVSSPASVSISNSVFAGNRGAGIYHSSSMSPSITNCLLAGNVDGSSGGLYLTNSSPQITNCTFVLNQGSTVGGMFASGSGVPTVDNSIFWGNIATADLNSPGEINVGDTVINQSIVEGGWSGSGSGVLDVDPLLVQGPSGKWTAAASFDLESNLTIYTDANADFVPGALKNRLINPDVEQPRMLHVFDNTQTTISVLGDFTEGMLPDQLLYGVEGGESYQVIDARVMPGSPAIDAGNNDVFPATIETDLDGRARFVDDPGTPDTGVGTPPLIDMGPYEFQPLVLGDVTGDGVVNVADLLAVINAWGQCPAPPALCPADVNGDGQVGVSDLLLVISNWS